MHTKTQQSRHIKMYSVGRRRKEGRRGGGKGVAVGDYMVAGLTQMLSDLFSVLKLCVSGF